jgi:ElaB/YqjD/DUF883 family membrane-anchored ribosome-binding protein
MRLTTAVTTIAALAVPALGELAVTSPTASTTCSGGQRCTVAWSDNGSGATLAQQGNTTVALYTGGKSQQTFLQPIAFPDPVNVATVDSIEFTVDPAVGENGRFYFIRFSSVALKDGANPYLSFSAVFTLDRMTGTFNSTVKDQLQDVNTSSTGPSTSGAASSTSSAAASQTKVATTTRSSTSAGQSASASASASNQGSGFVNASPVTYTGVAVFIGAVVGLFL